MDQTMFSMRPDQQLIDRFYEGTCSAEEARLVMAWLLKEQQEPAEWVESSEKGEYPEHWEAEMLAFVANATAPGGGSGKNNPEGILVDFGRQGVDDQLSRGRMHRSWPWKKLAVAASVALIGGLAFMGLYRKGSPAGSSAGASAINAAGKKPVIIESDLHERLVKAGNKSSVLRLADGSTVLLKQGASLRYDSNSYNVADRTLYLEGEAVFNVAAEKNKPFSVVANGFSTTALGTSFMVSTSSINNIQVRLFSGKVVIRQMGVLHAGAVALSPMKDVYLRPGEELVYNSAIHQSLVSRWQPGVGPTQLLNGWGHSGLAQRGIRLLGDTLVFDNTQLADVLELLQKSYRVKIHYDRKTIGTAYFTGRILPGDAIELILNTVTRINKLTLIASNDEFVIR